jgi:hypothetical protein
LIDCIIFIIIVFLISIRCSIINQQIMMQLWKARSVESSFSVPAEIRNISKGKKAYPITSQIIERAIAFTAHLLD